MRRSFAFALYTGVTALRAHQQMLDVVGGEGYFVGRNGAEPFFTRAGAFGVDAAALDRLDDNYYGLTSESGPALIGAGLSGGRGAVEQKALESSNVDVALECPPSLPHTYCCLTVICVGTPPPLSL